MRESIPEILAPLTDQVDWDSAKKARKSFANGNCVELAPGEGVVGFQDSKQEGMPDRTRLVVETGVAAAFFAGVKAGEFDL